MDPFNEVTSDPYNPIKLIKEIKQRPALFDNTRPIEREEKLEMWKEVAAAIYPDWERCNKATAYDRGKTTKPRVNRDKMSLFISCKVNYAKSRAVSIFRRHKFV